MADHHSRNHGDKKRYQAVSVLASRSDPLYYLAPNATRDGLQRFCSYQIPCTYDCHPNQLFAHTMSPHPPHPVGAPKLSTENHRRPWKFAHIFGNTLDVGTCGVPRIHRVRPRLSGACHNDACASHPAGGLHANSCLIGNPGEERYFMYIVVFIWGRSFAFAEINHPGSTEEIPVGGRLVFSPPPGGGWLFPASRCCPHGGE